MTSRMRIRLSLLLRGLSGALVIAFTTLATACGPRGVQPAGTNFVRLPFPDPGTMSVSGETREGRWLSGGEAITWTIPPSLGGKLEASFYLPESDGSEVVEVRRRVANGATEVCLRSPLRADPAAWQRLVLEWPARKKESELEIRFEAAAERARQFLAVPVLRVPGQATNRTVVLVIVDTLRADHLSAYGYGPRTSPNIDRFFEGGTKVSACFSTEPWTLPSIASILTSSPAAVHRTGLDRPDLPKEIPNLAEEFQRAGYRTLAVTGGGFVDPERGFARGFDRYVTTDETASGAVQRALRMVAEYRGEPLFLLFHTYQVHDYRTDKEAAENLFGEVSFLGGAWDSPIVGITDGKSESEILESRPFLVNRYDAAIRSTDAAFGQLVSGLEKQDRLGGSVVLLTSDHGEDLLDRADIDGSLSFGHTLPTLFECGLHVPFLLRVPGGSKISTAAGEDRTLLDVAPTLLMASGLPSPPSFEGKPVQLPREGAGAIAAFAPGYDALAIRAGGRKLIARADYPLCSWANGREIRPLVPEECFDLRDDPGEAHSRSCSDPAFEPLWAEWERQVQRLFPGSLLIRNPSRQGRSSSLTMIAKGGVAAPLVTGFRQPLGRRKSGKDEGVEWETRRVTTWVAITPQDESRALSIRLSGLPALLAPKGLVIRDGAKLEWASLRGEPALRGGHDWWLVATVPAASRPARTRYVASEEAVRRLMSLGYMRAGPETLEAKGRAGSAESENVDGSLGRGEIQVRIVAPE